MSVKPCVLALSIWLFGAGFNPAMSAMSTSATRPEDATTLSAVERQLFFHTYSNEPDAVRLTRLEKYVFGAPNAAQSLSDRISKISSTITSQKPTVQAANPGKQPVGLPPSPLNHPVAAQPTIKSAARNIDFSHGLHLPVPDSVKEAMMNRSVVDRLRLSSSSVARVRATQPPTVADRVEILEKNIYGRKFAERPLQIRVASLEQNIFGAPKVDDATSLSDRVNDMWIISVR